MRVVVVDEKNSPVGSVSEEELYARKVNHRVTHVIAGNSKGELFLVQLSAQAPFCPGYWCTSAHGTVFEGESYEQAAQRQVKDWLGVSVELVKLHESVYDHYKMRKFVHVFRCNTSSILLNPERAITGRWFSVADIKDMVRKNQLVHPELAYVVEKLYS